MGYLQLKEILKSKGISGKDLASRLNVSENTISFASSGKQQPRFELMEQIAKELEIDIRDLFHPTKDKESIELFFKNQDGEMKKLGDLLPNDGVELK